MIMIHNRSATSISLGRHVTYEYIQTILSSITIMILVILLVLLEPSETVNSPIDIAHR